MFDDGSGIDDAVVTDLGSGVYDSFRHHYGACAYTGRLRYDGGRMDGGIPFERKCRELITLLRIADSDYEGAVRIFRMIADLTNDFIGLIVIKETEDFVAACFDDVFDYMPVAAGSDYDHILHIVVTLLSRHFP